MSEPHPTDGRPAQVERADAEEIRTLFHRLWSRAATGDPVYLKPEWKRLAELLRRYGIEI